MAHYAELDKNNQVIRVVVIDNQHDETESMGKAYCQSLFKTPNWIKTSYNSNIRKKFAGIGDTYDFVRDAFIAPCPFSSWVFNESTCRWDPPTPCPDSTRPYLWDEITTSWIAK